MCGWRFERSVRIGLEAGGRFERRLFFGLDHRSRFERVFTLNAPEQRSQCTQPRIDEIEDLESSFAIPGFGLASHADRVGATRRGSETSGLRSTTDRCLLDSKESRSLRNGSSVVEVTMRLVLVCVFGLAACGPARPRLTRVMRNASDSRCTSAERHDVIVVGQVDRPAAVEHSMASTVRDAVRAGGGLTRRATILRVRWCDESGSWVDYRGRIRELTECDWTMPLTAGATVFADLDEGD